MDKNIREIFTKTLSKIKPKKEKFSEVDDIIKKINSLIKENKIKGVCVAAGSYSKGTILKNDFDVDLFVRFDYSYKNEDLSEMLANIIKPLKAERVHGSRDYFQLKRKGFLFEIVPVLFISDYKQAVNVTDMSPLHVDYIKKNVTKKMGDNVRLAKQFCKGSGVYGAESYIRGFSGHVLDLLTIHYGSFLDLLMQASVWGDRVVIDIGKHLKDPMKELDKSKLISPLIIVDPVQPDRNAAAAISKEKFDLFKQRAKEFLSNPKQSFFVVKKINQNDLVKKAGNNNLFFFEVVPQEGKTDVVGAKVLKCFEHFTRNLKKHSFSLVEKGWQFNSKKSILYFIVKSEKLSKTIITRGPPVKVKANATSFKERHKNSFVKNKRLYAEIKREYTNPKRLIKDLLKDDYVKSRVKKIVLK